MKKWETALVTGASSGIGRAIAQYLAASGTKVTLVARSEEGLLETASMAPDRMEAMPADLSKTSDVNAVVKHLQSEQTDLLVNNAGIWKFSAFSDISPKTAAQMLEVNVISLTKLCHSVIPQMKERKSGDILNVSSIAGGQPLPMESLYAATKAFVTNFSQGLYAELKPFNIMVTALLPGLVRTNLFERGDGADSVEKMPDFMWMDAWPVAEAALKAVSAKKPICVPGALNKTLSSIVEVTPRPLIRTFAGRAMKLRVENPNQPKQQKQL